MQNIVIHYPISHAGFSIFSCGLKCQPRLEVLCSNSVKARLAANNKAYARMPKRRRASEMKTVIIDVDDYSDSDSRREQLKRRGSCNTDSRHLGQLGSDSFDRYLKDIWASLEEDQRALCTYIDCSWFSLYMKEPFKERVLNWIKRKDIFKKKYVFIPILCWSHWSLLVFCHFGGKSKSKSRKPCMLLLDSMHMADPMRLEPTIRKFVLDIFRATDRPEKGEQISEIPFFVPKVPQQRGDKECGYYVLYFIKLFVNNAPKNFNHLKGYPYFMREDWFGHEDFDSFYMKLTS